jgi:lipopolysaccharide biosynthesis protein
VRVLAFYLPQFHPIPENDEWWGTGFTEWTNVAKARPLFPGHYQPHIPRDLGFYDLRVPETRAAQAAMARQYGIEGFCYYHYWFAGKRLLNRPFDEVVASGKPDFPFCLCWANESWSGVWHGAPKRILVRQTYPGEEDHRRHFETLLPAFRDERYVRVDGKPLFAIYSPATLPNCAETLTLWRKMARSAGLDGLHLVAVAWDHDWDPAAHGFDAAVIQRLAPRRPWYHVSQPLRIAKGVLARLFRLPTIYRYRSVIPRLLPRALSNDALYPCVVPNWDNTPRSGTNGFVLHGSTPELFGLHMRRALSLTSHIATQRRMIFVKSWNEWAEGNHLEPDCRFGHAYLEALREALAWDASTPTSRTVSRLDPTIARY